MNMNKDKMCDNILRILLMYRFKIILKSSNSYYKNKNVLMINQINVF